MCGICGFTGRQNKKTLNAMVESLNHRGPDGSGTWQGRGVNLGLTRLAILDPHAPHAPLRHPTRDLTLVFNGELYNHHELHQMLQARGITLQTRTDSECVLQLYALMGKKLLAHLQGMYAFAIWDGHKNELFCARDPMGIKPLVYTQQNGDLIIASEVKSLLQHPAVQAQRDDESTHLLLNLRFVPGPRTLFKNIFKLPPGHFLTFSPKENRLHLQQFADVRQKHAHSNNAAHEVGELSSALRQAIARQSNLQEDRAIFLSGGLDSSVLASGLNANNHRGLHAFSLGLGEPGDEVANAAEVAGALDMPFHARILRGDFHAEMAHAIWHSEVPRINGLQAYKLSQFARDEVRVAFSGLGADEIFGGYDIYLIPALMDRLDFMGPLLGDKEASLKSAMKELSPLVSKVGGQAERAFYALGLHHNNPDLYAWLRGAWDVSPDLFLEMATPAHQKRQVTRSSEAVKGAMSDHQGPRLGALMQADLRLKMVDDFLENEDRSSMAHGLEVRVPYLDDLVVSRAYRLPNLNVFSPLKQKQVLREVGKGWHLPQKALATKKRGFTFDPVAQMDKSMGLFARHLLTSERLERWDILRPQWVQRQISGAGGAPSRWGSFLIWILVGLALWEQMFIDGEKPEEVQLQLEKILRG